MKSRSDGNNYFIGRPEIHMGNARDYDAETGVNQICILFPYPWISQQAASS
jgi:hypothetical protein